MFENLTHYDVDELCDWLISVKDIGGEFLNHRNEKLIENWWTDFDVKDNLTQQDVFLKIGHTGVMLCFEKGKYINLLISRNFFEKLKIPVITGHIVLDTSYNFLLIPESNWYKRNQ